MEMKDMGSGWIPASLSSAGTLRAARDRRDLPAGYNFRLHPGFRRLILPKSQTL